MIPSVRARWADLAAAGGPISLDDLLALPEDRWRYELVEGRLVLRPPADLRYALVARALAEAVRGWALSTGIGGETLLETGFVVSADGELDTVYVPALAYVCKEHLMDGQIPTGIGSLRLVPDLVVEIASPTQQRTELGARAARWLAAGSKLVWVVWPARRQMEVWVQDPGEPTVTSYAVHETLQGFTAMPGFSYQIAHAFV